MARWRTHNHRARRPAWRPRLRIHIVCINHANPELDRLILDTLRLKSESQAQLMKDMK